MKILEKYKEKSKVMLNGVIEGLSNDEIDKIIDKHNSKITKAKLLGEKYKKIKDEKFKGIQNNKDCLTPSQLEKLLTEWSLM